MSDSRQVWRGSQAWRRCLVGIALGLALTGCKRKQEEDPEILAVTRGESASDAIGAEGGTLALADGFSLEVPAGALTQATEITITRLEGDLDRAWLLEPSGLQFAVPAIGRTPIVPTETEPARAPGVLSLSEDGSASWVPGRIEGDVFAFDVEHFSVSIEVYLELSTDTTVFGLYPGTSEHVLSFGEQDAVWPHAVDIPFFLAGVFRPGDPLAGRMVLDEFMGSESAYVWEASGLRLQRRRQVTVGPVTVLGVPNETLGVDLAPNEVASVPGAFLCTDPGDAVAVLWVEVVLDGFEFDGSGLFSPLAIEVSGTTGSSYELSAAFTEDLDLPDVITADFGWGYNLRCTYEYDASRPPFGPTLADAVRFKAGLKNPVCTNHSDGTKCDPARPEERIEGHLDPLLVVNDIAAQRLFDTEFPCAGTNDATVVCGPLASSAAGEYVFLLDVMGAPLPTDDPTGSYQYGFVFDADGDPSNNYTASPQYPKDFWQGTDKWYDLAYTPGTGYRLVVKDVRQGFAEVPSGARYVLRGRELALFIPRDELGAAPAYRTTAFRHEGDWGATGPWSADYMPLLGEPLLAVDAGDPIVINE